MPDVFLRPRLDEVASVYRPRVESGSVIPIYFDVLDVLTKMPVEGAGGLAAVYWLPTHTGANAPGQPTQLLEIAPGILRMYVDTAIPGTYTAVASIETPSRRVGRLTFLAGTYGDLVVGETGIPWNDVFSAVAGMAASAGRAEARELIDGLNVGGDDGAAAAVVDAKYQIITTGLSNRTTALEAIDHSPAPIAARTILGNASGALARPVSLTPAQVAALLPAAPDLPPLTITGNNSGAAGAEMPLTPAEVAAMLPGLGSLAARSVLGNTGATSGAAVALSGADIAGLLPVPTPAPSLTIMGNNTGAPAQPGPLTPAQVAAMLPAPALVPALSLWGNNTTSPAQAAALTPAQVAAMLPNQPETGLWTPAVNAATPGDLTVTYGTTSGNYRLAAGRAMADIDFVMVFTPVYTTASGAFWITGLPFFTHGRSSGGMLLLSSMTSFAWGTNITQVSLAAMPGQARLQILTARTGAGTVYLTLAAFTSGASVTLRGHGSYPLV